MYRRVEQIEEENLDWDQQPEMQVKEIHGQKENVISPPAFKSKKTLLQHITELNIEKRLIKLFNRNMEIASFLAVLLLPYFVGFLFAYMLFYTYGDMSIIGFLSIEKDHILLQLWSIGAYLFVTSWVFWAFSQIVQNSKQLLLLSHR